MRAHDGALLRSAPARMSEVCLLLEGTYPYVAGGVSSWVHDIVKSLPELGFSLVHIGPQPGAYGPARYTLPDNVTGLSEHWCHDPRTTPNEHNREEILRRVRALKRQPMQGGSRTLAALRRLHLEDGPVDDALVADLAHADLSLEELLHGDESFALIAEIAHARAGGAPFLDFFWHFRSMHVPVVRLLNSELPPAAVYHSVSTGYAGLLAAAASQRTGRPMLLTEHGIYARERDMELARASWIGDPDLDARMPELTTSPLRRFWSRFFARLSQVAYHQAQSIVTLSEVNRQKQLDDGAAADKTAVVPNGVDVDGLLARMGPRTERAAKGPLRVGFVGRVVPIKDVLTFIKACDLAMREVPMAVDIIGPADEDAAYAERCRELTTSLGREDDIRFVGPRPLAELYNNIDVCVLTSFSEGQPLVILEAHAAGLPVIATDVGACREMLEGGSDADRRLGKSGIVTRVAAPEETAAAMIRLAGRPELGRAMGEAGRQRVRDFYGKTRMIDAYRALYQGLAS